MPKSNIRLLTNDERHFFNNNYIFTLKDDVILVKVKDYDRTTSHPIDKGFSISTKMRKIKISVEAINMWKDNFVNSKHSLIDVQNAINALTLSYQSLSYDDVKSQLINIEKKDNEPF